MNTIQEEIKDWLEQAQADLSASKDNLTMGHYYVSVSLAQQCVEKALKSLYIQECKQTPPKTHDLIQLGMKVKVPKKLLIATGSLSATYFSSRYPGTGPEIPVKFYTKEKAQYHIIEAEALLKWIQKKIKL